ADGDLDLATVGGVLAYSCATGDSLDICIEVPATGERWNVTNTAGTNETDPSWAPEGDRIVAVRWTPGAEGNHNPFQPGAGELVAGDVSDPDDPATTVVGFRGFMPSWGLEGRIAYSRYEFEDATWNRAAVEVRVLKPSLGGGWSDIGVISPAGSQ